MADKDTSNTEGYDKFDKHRETEAIASNDEIGTTGPIGISGTEGDPGEYGPIGVRGVQGGIGVQGPTNQHGPKGQQGVDGKNAGVLVSPEDMCKAIDDLRNEIRNLNPRLSTNPMPPIDRYKMDDVTKIKLERTFTHHPPTPDQIPRYTEIRRVGHELALLLSRMCPPSSELDIAIDCLSGAIMWGNAAIARNENHYADPQPSPNQPVYPMTSGPQGTSMD